MSRNLRATQTPVAAPVKHSKHSPEGRKKTTHMKAMRQAKYTVRTLDCEALMRELGSKVVAR